MLSTTRTVLKTAPLCVAAFSTSKHALRRLRADVPLKDPIAPTIKNVTVREDHPMWQFFGDRQFIRNDDAIQSSLGRPWLVPELRGKSFEDLHSLWYICLKERNRLARELQIGRADGHSYNHLMALSDKIRESMWKIRHVLSERQHAFEAGKTGFLQEKDAYLESFKTAYVESASQNPEAEARLARLQTALFGIKTDLDEVNIDTDLTDAFVAGIKYVGEVKAAKYAKDVSEEMQLQLPLRDIWESYIFFVNPVTKMEDAFAQLKEKRQEMAAPVEEVREREIIYKFFKNLKAVEAAAEATTAPLS